MKNKKTGLVNTATQRSELTNENSPSKLKNQTIQRVVTRGDQEGEKKRKEKKTMKKLKDF